MKIVTVGLVLAALVITSPISASGSPQSPTNQFAPRDPLRLILRGPGSSIGATLRDITPAELEDQDIANGVVLGEVLEDGPASRAGLKDGDVVVKFGDEPARNARQLLVLVQHTPFGSTVKAIIVRDGISREVSLTTVSEY